MNIVTSQVPIIAFGPDRVDIVSRITDWLNPELLVPEVVIAEG